MNSRRDAGGGGGRPGPAAVGSAQGAAAVGDGTVLERLLTLAPLFAEVLLVANAPEPYARFGLRTVADVVPGRGAPGGVHAALAAAKTEWVLAVACDMPFVSPEAVRVLLEARGPEAARCSSRWRTRGAPARRLPGLPRGRRGASACGTEEPSLRELLAQCRARLLPEEALREVDAELRSLVNVNTPEDLLRHGLTRP